MKQIRQPGRLLIPANGKSTLFMGTRIDASGFVGEVRQKEKPEALFLHNSDETNALKPIIP
jgi:hypothetical protein